MQRGRCVSLEMAARVVRMRAADRTERQSMVGNVRACLCLAWYKTPPLCTDRKSGMSQLEISSLS
jgi:hypothetical protein